MQQRTNQRGQGAAHISSRRHSFVSRPIRAFRGRRHTSRQLSSPDSAGALTHTHTRLRVVYSTLLCVPPKSSNNNILLLLLSAYIYIFDSPPPPPHPRGHALGRSLRGGGMRGRSGAASEVSEAPSGRKRFCPGRMLLHVPCKREAVIFFIYIYFFYWFVYETTL